MLLQAGFEVRTSVPYANQDLGIGQCRAFSFVQNGLSIALTGRLCRLSPVIAWCYFTFGYAPVATAASPMPFEKRQAHIALNARIRTGAPKLSPLQATDQNDQAGVHLPRKLRYSVRLVGICHTPTERYLPRIARTARLANCEGDVSAAAGIVQA
jgi:hypothetical protein